MRKTVGMLALLFLPTNGVSAQDLSGDWGDICGGNLWFHENNQMVVFDCDNSHVHEHFGGEFEKGKPKAVAGSIIRRQTSTGCKLGPIPAHIDIIDGNHVVYHQENWPVGCDITAPAGGGTQDWRCGTKDFTCPAHGSGHEVDYICHIDQDFLWYEFHLDFQGHKIQSGIPSSIGRFISVDLDKETVFEEDEDSPSFSNSYLYFHPIWKTYSDTDISRDKITYRSNSMDGNANTHVNGSIHRILGNMAEQESRNLIAGGGNLSQSSPLPYP